MWVAQTSALPYINHKQFTPNSMNLKANTLFRGQKYNKL